MQKNDSDSVRLVNNQERLLQLNLGKLKDEVKILEILELSKLESVQISKNLRIEHTVDIIIDGEHIIDTLQYISFNNQDYSYLNRNLFLEGR